MHLLFPEHRDGKQCCTKGCKRNRHWTTKSKCNPLNYYCKPCQERLKKHVAEQREARAEYFRKESVFAAMNSERTRDYALHRSHSSHYQP